MYNLEWMQTEEWSANSHTGEISLVRSKETEDRKVTAQPHSSTHLKHTHLSIPAQDTTEEKAVQEKKESPSNENERSTKIEKWQIWNDKIMPNMFDLFLFLYFFSSFFEFFTLYPPSPQYFKAPFHWKLEFYKLSHYMWFLLKLQKPHDTTLQWTRQALIGWRMSSGLKLHAWRSEKW